MKRLFLNFAVGVAICSLPACVEEDFGANPYDPSTPVTVSQLPKVTGFEPAQGKAGTLVTITGKNFTTATDVTFGGKSAESFTVKDDATIEAVVSTYGATGAVAVTNHKGTRSMEGFRFIKPLPSETENPNLALNAYVTSSTPLAGNASAVNNGDLTDLLQLEDEDGAEKWVMLELDKVYSINTVNTFWDGAAPASEGELQVSVDGQNWTTVETWVDWIFIAWTDGPSFLDEGKKNFTFKNVDAKFVRLAKLDNKSEIRYKVTLKEVEVYNTPPKVNVNYAVNGYVTSSTPLAGSPSVVNNGDLTDLLQLEDEDGAEKWVMIELDNVYSINTVKTFWDGAAPASEGELQISVDGQTWTTIKTWVDWIFIAWTDGPSFLDEGKKVFRFDNVDAKYVRLAKLDNKSEVRYKVTLKEVEIYNATPPENYCVNAMVTASDPVTGQASNVVDGDKGTWWQAAVNAGSWVQIDLCEPRTINNVVSYWDQAACATEQKISVSVDGEEWEEVFSIASWDAASVSGVSDVTFDAKENIRYVKFHDLDNTATPWNITLFEVQVYNVELD